MSRNKASQSVGVLVVGMLGALILALFGDMLVYDEEADGLGFEEGTTGATLVEYSPIIVLALAFYGAFQKYE